MNQSAKSLNYVTAHITYSTYRWIIHKLFNWGTKLPFMKKQKKSQYIAGYLSLRCAFFSLQKLFSPDNFIKYLTASLDMMMNEVNLYMFTSIFSPLYELTSTFNSYSSSFAVFLWIRDISWSWASPSIIQVTVNIMCCAQKWDQNQAFLSMNTICVLDENGQLEKHLKLHCKPWW